MDTEIRMQTNQDMLTLEDEIATLLTDLSAIQNDLLQVLSNKRDLMAAGDTDAMSRLQPAEQELCDRLQQCHDRRADLLRTASDQGMPADNLRELAKALPGQNLDGFGRQADEIASRMRLLQHQSLTNWVLAQKSLLHISQMLEIIASGGQLQPTYSKGEPTRPRGSLVDQEV